MSAFQSVPVTVSPMLPYHPHDQAWVQQSNVNNNNSNNSNIIRSIDVNELIHQFNVIDKQWSRLESLRFHCAANTSHEHREKFNWRSSTFDHTQFPYLRHVDFGPEKKVLPTVIATATLVPPSAPLVGVELNPGPPLVNERADDTLSSPLVSSASWTSSRDLITFVYSFLNLSDLSLTVRINRLWSKCCLLTPPRCVKMRDDNEVVKILQSIQNGAPQPISPMFAHHVTDIIISDEKRKVWLVPLPHDQLSLTSQLVMLANEFKNLRALTIYCYRTCATGGSDEPERYHWIHKIPDSVTNLFIVLSISIYRLHTDFITFTQHLVSSSPQLSSLWLQIRLQEIEFRQSIDNQLLFDAFPVAMLSELQKLPHLQELYYALNAGWTMFDVSDQHYEVLRSFPALTQLECDETEDREEQLYRLKSLMPQPGEDGSTPPFARLPISCAVNHALLLNDESAPVLQQYRWLKELAFLAPIEPISESNRWHTEFSSLASLTVASFDADVVIHEETLVHAFSFMPNVTTFHFRRAYVTTSTLTRCLAQLRHLKSLELCSLKGLDSLSFIRVLPHCTMKSIEIDQSRSEIMSISELSHILTVEKWSRIESLILRDIFAMNISHDMRERLNWRSSTFDHTQFPYLRHVDFGPEKTTIVPPSPPLVGVELNPGPPSKDVLSSPVVSFSSWTQSLDLIALMYSFLSFEDDIVLIAVRVNRLWLKCGSIIPSREIRFNETNVDALLRSISDKPSQPVSLILRHHLTQIDISDQDNQAPLSIQLGQLTVNLHNLRSITITTKSEEYDWLSEIPTSITALRIHPTISIHNSPVALPSLANKILSSCPQLESLHLIIGIDWSADKPHLAPVVMPSDSRFPIVFLSKLSQLSRLQTFHYTLAAKLPFHVTAEHLAILRSFPALTDLQCGQVTNRLKRLKMLIPQRDEEDSEEATAPPLRFIELPVSRVFNDAIRLDDESASVLRHYRWLKKLQLYLPLQPISEKNRWRFEFTDLTDLDLSSLGMERVMIHDTSIIHAFSCWPNVTILLFEYALVSTDLITRCLAQLSHLTRLHLCYLEGLDSLSFCAVLPHRTIEFIEIAFPEGGTRIASEELEKQFFLTTNEKQRQWSRLTFLAFHDVFSSPVSDSITRRFNWKSPRFDQDRFPYLRDFNITTTKHDENHEEQKAEDEGNGNENNVVPPAPLLVGVELNPGPSSKEAADATSSSLPITASSSTWSESRDLVRSIYAFLTFKEIATCGIVVSRLWHQCGLTIPSRQIQRGFATYIRLLHLMEKNVPVSSMLVHHLHEIFLRNIMKEPLSSQLRPLTLAGQIFKNLASLDLSVNAEVESSAMNEWVSMIPNSVVKLDISLEEISILKMADPIFTFVQQIVSSCPQLESLTVFVNIEEVKRRRLFDDNLLSDGRCLPVAVLSQLSQLENLQYLAWHLDIINGLPSLFTDAHYQVLRSFPALTQLESDSDPCWTQEDRIHRLKSLLPQGVSEADAEVPLRFIELPFGGAMLFGYSSGAIRLDDDAAPILQQYRWLKELKFLIPLTPISESNRWHTQFDHLTSLELQSLNTLEVIHEDSLVHAFSCMPHLTQLTFSNMCVTSQLLIRCISQLSQLKHFTLEDGTRLVDSSFSFLHILPHRTMVSIRIDLSVPRWSEPPTPKRTISVGIDVNEFIQHFDTVPCWFRLESLKLLNIFTDSVSSAIRERFNWQSSTFDHTRFPYLRQVDFGLLTTVSALSYSLLSMDKIA